MKIERIELTNFMGINGKKTIDFPKLAAMIGPNGAGKTTILNAIRYGLTGLEPDADIINKDSDVMRVSITMIDPADGVSYDFLREKTRDKPSKWKINGKAANAKAMNEKIESIIGIPLEKVKLLSSGDLVAAMKPQEFSSFILDYIPEKMKLEDVISMIPDTTMGMIDAMTANIPAEGIDIETITQFYDICMTNRKELKGQIEAKTAVYNTKPKEAPALSKEEIEKALFEINGASQLVQRYHAEKMAYDKAVANRENYQKTIEQLKKEYTAIEASRPDPEITEKLKKEMDSLNETISNQKISKAGMEAAIKRMENELLTLEKPTCPLSPLIICKQDKTAAKEEIENSIAATRDGLVAVERELTKAVEKLTAVSKQKETQQRNEALYAKKVQIARQIKTMEETMPVIPAEPEKPELPENVAEERVRLNAALKAISEYEEGVILSKQLEILKNSHVEYDRLVKAFAEKGVVRTSIISAYLKVFEDICNERSTKFRPGIDFRFVSEDGVVVLMNNGKGVYLPYGALSGGEKAYMIFILMDMLSSLCGTNILLLDELSVVDKDCFDALLDIISDCATSYDHILLAAVDHEDIVNSVKSHSIPVLSLEAEVTE